MAGRSRAYNGSYRGEHLNRVAFPLGGIGAGMICMEGTGALSHVSLRHRPEVFNEPRQFSALFIEGAPMARVIEGPVPTWKSFGDRGTGNGCKGGCAAGLPRFADCSFAARFPFATVRLSDPAMPVTVEVTGWSPFIPGDADSASLPVLALEYRIRNASSEEQKGVYSFHAANFMAVARDSGACVRALPGGFAFVQPPMDEKPDAEGSLAVFVDDPATRSDGGWFRGGWFDSLTMLWKTVLAGGAPARPPHAEGKPGGGGSLYVPFVLAPGAEKTIRLQMAWHVPRSTIRCGAGSRDPKDSSYVPWYAGRFADLDAVVAFWKTECDRLRAESVSFSECFYDTTLPPEVVEAVAANLTILKSPTCLRQTDGRFWGWEGCCDESGCCAGTCTHVWNYAQAMPHLFPTLERTLRETEFNESQDERGHQNFRSSLPIRPPDHGSHAAADGQLGGIMKAHREWRISGDDAWLKAVWPKVKRSLLYCIETWDPEHQGTLVEPHHNTYDIEFWGADGLCTSFYLGALTAAAAMGKACGDDVALFDELRAKARRKLESDLWNGEYFIQKPQWQGLRADPAAFVPLADHADRDSPEALEIMRKEGPKYQYGSGCLSDGVLGEWIARCCGVDTGLSRTKVRKHLAAVFRHNFKTDLSGHSNTQRPSFACGKEGGLLVCSWPRGDKPSLPLVYSDEVWTGMEYHVASHLIMSGKVREGLRIVRAARDRYDGRVRNPFNEYECGHWYARAMSSYGLLQALSGARYDAVEKTLYLAPAIRGDFRAFLSTATGYGTVGLRDGQPFVEVKRGTIDVRRVARA